jgi:hypothetical protein
MKLNVYSTESYCTWIVREPIEVDTDNYPELAGMTEDEVKEHIRYNSSDMKPMNGEYYDSLHDELMDSDIRRDKINNEDWGIIFDGE